MAKDVANKQLEFVINLIKKDLLRKEIEQKTTKKYQISKWHFNKIYPKARKLVDELVTAGIKAANDTYIATKIDEVKHDIISKQEALEILSKIAKGTVSKYGDVVLIPTQSDKTKAIAEMAKLEGWVTTKVDHTTNGKELPATPTITKVILKI
jgi:hypothetical protein